MDWAWASLMALVLVLWAVGLYWLDSRTKKRIQHTKTRRMWTQQELDQYTALLKMGALSRKAKKEGM